MRVEKNNNKTMVARLQMKLQGNEENAWWHVRGPFELSSQRLPLTIISKTSSLLS